MTRHLSRTRQFVIDLKILLSFKGFRYAMNDYIYYLQKNNSIISNGETNFKEIYLKFYGYEIKGVLEDLN